ncbi:MAG: alpha/beta fold hydrolase [Gammaproteobacteria bacterium]
MNVETILGNLSVNGFEMYYQVIGEGEPLLILHGFTGSGADLVRLFSNMGDKFKLIIPDLRGHGQSTNPSKQFTFKQAALDTIALLEHLNISQCKAIGFSGGGCTLLQMAFIRPDLIQSMVLVSAAPYFPENAKLIMKAYAQGEKTQAQWEALRNIHTHGDEQINLLFEHAASFGEDPNDMKFTPEMLSKISTHTLVVQGDKDAFYPLDLTISLYQSLPNANLWILPNSGHVPISPDNVILFQEYALGHFHYLKKDS